MANAYDLAQRINKTGARPIELGTVVRVDPLVISIDGANYDSRVWNIYEPTFMGENIKLWGLDLVNDVTGAKYEFNTKCKTATSDMRYHENDLIAVQQMAGDKSFLILTKIKKVE